MAPKSQQQQYFLRWNNYGHHITHAFDNLRTNDDLVDVTLCCEGKKIKAHKVLLSACSGYFKEAFRENPHPHPFIIFKFVKFEELRALIEFMYQGEVNIKQEVLQSFLQTADLLSVHGLNANGVETPTSQLNQMHNSGILRLNPDRCDVPNASTKSGILHINPDRSENLNWSNTSPESKSGVLHLIPTGLQPPHTLLTNTAKKRKFSFPQDHDVYTTSECNFKDESLDQSIEDANDEQGQLSSYIDLSENTEMSDSETHEYHEIIDDSEIAENYQQNYSTAVIDNVKFPHNSAESSKGGVNSTQDSDGQRRKLGEFFWTEDEGTFLLERHSEYIGEVGKRFRSKTIMWTQIARDFKEQMGVIKTTDQVYNKYKTIIRTKRRQAKKLNAKTSDPLHEECAQMPAVDDTIDPEVLIEFNSVQLIPDSERIKLPAPLPPLQEDVTDSIKETLFEINERKEKAKLEREKKKEQKEAKKQQRHEEFMNLLKHL